MLAGINKADQHQKQSRRSRLSFTSSCESNSWKFELLLIPTVSSLSWMPSIRAWSKRKWGGDRLMWNGTSFHSLHLFASLCPGVIYRVRLAESLFQIVNSFIFLSRIFCRYDAFFLSMLATSAYPLNMPSKQSDMHTGVCNIFAWVCVRCICICACMCVHLYVYVHVCMCVCVRVFMHVCIYICTYVCGHSLLLNVYHPCKLLPRHFNLAGQTSYILNWSLWFFIIMT
jgi:hypothetical protein